MSVLLTTTVGSFPKPSYLKKARAAAARGEMSREELHELELRATREVIALQEEVGLDVLVDGEMERGDMTTFFAEKMGGFAVSGLVRSYGNRYYRKPIVVGPVEWRSPMTVNMYDYATGLTDKPVKGILTGPYTMTDWSFDEYYGSRERLVMALAEELRREVDALESAGASWIQIDEPALSVRPEELPLAIRAMKIMTDGVKARTVSHICYGDFETIYPELLELPVDQLDLELANSDFDMLELFRRAPFTKEIGLGVVDVHTHRDDDPRAVAEGIRRTLELIPAERVFVDPDCGLKTRTTEEARRKLTIMVEAVQRVRAELADGARGGSRGGDA